MARFHHYVPKFHLRNFSTNTKSIGMFNLKHNKYIKKASIAKTAGSYDLYGEDQIIENMFASDLEGIWATQIKDIISNQSIDVRNKEKYYELLLFIYFSQVRTKKFADKMDTFVNDQVKIIAELSYIHDPEFRNLAPKSAFDKIMETGTWGLRIPNLPYLQKPKYILDTISDLYPILLINKTSQNFITSDSPTVLYNSFIRDKGYVGPPGYGLVGAQVYCPISNKYCVALIDPVIYNINNINHHNHSLSIDTSYQVNYLNLLMLNESYDNLYFNEDCMEHYIRALIKYLYPSKVTIDTLPLNVESIFSIRKEFSDYKLADKFYFPYLRQNAISVREKIHSSK